MHQAGERSVRTIDGIKAVADVQVEQRHESTASDCTAHAAAFDDKAEFEIVGARSWAACAVKALLEHTQHLVVLLCVGGLRVAVWVRSMLQSMVQIYNQQSQQVLQQRRTAGNRLAGVSTGGGLGMVLVRRRRKSRPMPEAASSTSSSETVAVATGPSTLCCAGSAGAGAVERERRFAVRTLLRPNQPSGWAEVVGGDAT